MLAILYLLLALWIGDVLCRRFLAYGSVLHRLATAFVVGLVASTWVTYIGVATYVRVFHFLFPKTLEPAPMLAGDLLFLAFFYAVWKWWPREPAMFLPRPAGRARWDVLLFLVWLGFACWMMWGSLSYGKDGVIHMAVRQWSDFGATLAIVQSFAIGHNFPPEYPHFSGPPLSYHYLFHFQAGHLIWLGLRLHNAFNLLAALSFVALPILIMTLGERLTKSRAIARFGALLFYFHCSLDYVPFLQKQPSWVEAAKAILHKDGFLESIYNYRGELWGIWTLNIIANQRHLASAISLMLIVLIFLVDAYDWRLAWPKRKPVPIREPEVVLAPASVPEPAASISSEVETPAAGGSETAMAPEALATGEPSATEGSMAIGAEPVSYVPAPTPEAAPEAVPEATPEAMPASPLAAAESTPEAVPAPAAVEVVPPAPAVPELADVLEPEPGPTPVPGGSRFDLLLSFAFSGFLLGLLPLWNGPVFITAAIVLAGMFLLLPLRGYMIALGAMSGIIGIPQLILWRTGGAAANAAVYPMIHFGYVIDDPTFRNFANFLAFTFGFKWLVMVAAIVPVRERARKAILPLFGLAALVAFVLWLQPRYQIAPGPMKGFWIVAVSVAALVLLQQLGKNGVLGRVHSAIFLSTFGLVVLTFFVLFSIENAANHKFMYIWIAIINIAVALVLYHVARWGVFGLLAAVLLTLGMTLGGFIDIFPFHNDGTIDIAMEHDEMYEWIRDKTDPRDVFLTDSYVAHPILLAGRKIFHGHDYYAWSAGYNTDERLAQMKELYSETDIQTLVSRLNAFHIRWVCFDDPFSQGDVAKNEWLIRGYFKVGYEDKEGKHDHYRIYRVPTMEEWAQQKGVPVAPVIAPTPTPSAPAPPPAEHLARGFGLALSPTGDLLAAEADTGAIQRIGPGGQFLGGLGMPEYKEPQGVAVDKNAFVYVADTWNQRIVKLTPTGYPVATLPTPDGGFYAPRDVTVSPEGHIFVTNTGRLQIVHYDGNGVVVATWGGTKGKADGQFDEPLGVVAAHHEVYIADYGNARIQVFTEMGKFLRRWDVPEWKGAPAWQRPGLAFYEGRLYVGAPSKPEILVFSPKGDVVGRITSPELRDPSGMAVTPAGYLYVLNTETGTVAIASLSAKTGLAIEVKRFAPPLPPQ